jgi:hypothetical protein
LTVTAVTGPEVRRWSQTGDRVLVWLDRAPPRARLELSGWLPLTNGELHLPAPRPGSAQAQTTLVRLTAEPGLGLVRRQAHGLVPLPGLRPSEHDQGLAAAGDDFGGVWQVRPAAVAATCRALTLLEVRQRQVRFTAVLEAQAPRGELRALTLRLRGWDGDRPDLRADGAGLRRQRRIGASEWAWDLELAPGADRCRLTLEGGVSLDAAAAGLAAPEVSVEGAAAERWLATAGADLAAEAVQGLAEVADVRALLSAWPELAGRVRGGGVWRVTGPEFRLQVVPRPRPAGAAAEVFLAEHRLTLADGRHWLHETVLWLGHEAGADLTLSWPEAVTVLALSVDGAEAAPLQPEPRRLWLSLPGPAGVRRVRLLWRYDNGEDGPDRPRLLGPRLEGLSPWPETWTVLVPVGRRVAGVEGGLAAGPVQAAAADLARARAQYQISAALAREGREAGALAAGQRRFYRLCRDVELGLAQAAAVGEADADGAPTADRLEELLQADRRLAKEQHFEEVRAAAERQARAVRAGEDVRAEEGPPPGTPYRGVTMADAPTPRLTLAAEDPRPRPSAAGRWLAAAVGLGLVALLPLLWPPLRRLWPEQLALLGGLGWWLVGPTPVVVLLLALWAVARLGRPGRRLLRRLSRLRSPARAGGAA